MKAVLFIVLLTLAFSQVLHADLLISMNPRLLHKTDDSIAAIRDYGEVTKLGSKDYPTSTVNGRELRLPVCSLDKRWIFGSMIEASSSEQFGIARGAQLNMVRLSLEQEKLILYLVSPTTDSKPGVAEHIINRYSCRKEGEEIVVDLSNSSKNNMHAVYGDEKLSLVDSGGLLYDVQASHEHVSWVEKISLQSTDVGSFTLYVRFFLQQYEQSKTYTKRVYSREDQRKFGYFLTRSKLVDPLEGVYFEALANRIDVNKEVVYYLHPSIPEEYREACKEGILEWNDVFEAACGKRPLRVELGEEWMLPSDIRYRVIYWYDISMGRGGAYGPSTSDPLSGEIIDGDVVIFGGGIIGGLKKQWAAMNGINHTETKTIKEKTMDSEKEFTLFYGQGLELTYTCEGADPNIMSPETFPRDTGQFASEHEFICNFLRGLLCHEVGHTIGLRHNFSASADLDNLAEGEGATSIMDYIDFLKMAKPGVYDYAAIAYAYDGASDLYEGKNLLYHTDDEVGSVASCNMHDEGDPVEFHIQSLKGLEKKMLDWGLKTGELHIEWYESNYFRFLESLRKYVGADCGKQSDEAEAFFLSHVKGGNELIDNDEELDEEKAALLQELIAFQQLASGKILLSTKPNIITRGNPNRSFPRLSFDNRELVSRALADLIVNDKAPYLFRFRTINLLAEQRSSFSFAALKSAKRGLNWSGLKQFVNVFRKTKAQVKYERKQLKMDIERALNSFTD